MSDKSTAKAMFASLCSNYEGDKKVKEAKATTLVQQYELFKMKDDEDIETMYSRFQTLVSRLQILKKSYIDVDHVKKILRSLLAKWRLKEIVFEVSSDLNTLSLEDLISSLDEQEPIKKAKSIALKYKGKYSKALKANESEDESPTEGSEEE